MSGHRARVDMAMQDVARRSSTNGEVFKDRNEWGAQYLLSSAGAETRSLAPPSLPGQRIAITMIEDGGDVVVSAPAGQDFDGAAADTATFSAIGQWLVLESFWISPTVIEWRVTSMHAGVVIA